MVRGERAREIRARAHNRRERRGGAAARAPRQDEAKVAMSEEQAAAARATQPLQRRGARKAAPRSSAVHESERCRSLGASGVQQRTERKGRGRHARRMHKKARAEEPCVQRAPGQQPVLPA